jgi:hypothetical protein
MFSKEDKKPIDYDLDFDLAELEVHEFLLLHHPLTQNLREHLGMHLGTGEARKTLYYL